MAESETNSRLTGGSWPLNICSRNAVLSSVDMADILTKVNRTKSSMTVLNGLQQQVSRMAKETTIAMFAIARNGRYDDVTVLRRRKAELEEQLMLTRDRLVVTADDMLKLQSKLSILHEENEMLRRKLDKNRNSLRKKLSRAFAGNERTKSCPTPLSKPYDDDRQSVTRLKTESEIFEKNDKCCESSDGRCADWIRICRAGCATCCRIPIFVISACFGFLFCRSCHDTKTNTQY